MNQPAKPLSVDEILDRVGIVAFEPVGSAEETRGAIKAHLIELVESLPELQPVPCKQIQWQDEYTLSSCETCDMDKYDCYCGSNNRFKENIKQALIKAIKGENGTTK